MDSKKSKTQKEKIILAGEIAKQIKVYIKPLIKKGVPLLEIAEKIENKIKELGGEPSFPTNLSIDNIAAHYTPSHNDETLAHGLLKVDFGAHVDGWTSDTAFSIDLENNEENKKLIEASKQALDNAIKFVKEGNPTTGGIGKIVQETIESHGFSPIVNLSGHEMDQYELHAGLTIPNINDQTDIPLKNGLYAIEPFSTNGNGKVHDGSPSGIYALTNDKMPRSEIARDVLEFIIEKYQTLPFCSRWVVNVLGTKALFGLRQLEDNGNLHNFAQLVELKGSKVAQSENTILIEKECVIVTTE